jgi:hypothetical protein
MPDDILQAHAQGVAEHLAAIGLLALVEAHARAHNATVQDLLAASSERHLVRARDALFYGLYMNPPDQGVWHTPSLARAFGRSSDVVRCAIIRHAKRSGLPCPLGGRKGASCRTIAG